MGRIVNGTLSSTEDAEVYYFNSCAKAFSFYQGMLEYAKGENAEVCEAHPYMVKIKVGGSDEGFGTNVASCPHPGCVEPDEELMVAFRPSAMPSGSGYSDYQVFAAENGYHDGSNQG